MERPVAPTGWPLETRPPDVLTGSLPPGPVAPDVGPSPAVHAGIGKRPHIGLARQVGALWFLWGVSLWLAFAAFERIQTADASHPSLLGSFGWPRQSDESVSPEAPQERWGLGEPTWP
jgi:hypothetical protein